MSSVNRKRQSSRYTLKSLVDRSERACVPFARRRSRVDLVGISPTGSTSAKRPSSKLAGRSRLSLDGARFDDSEWSGATLRASVLDGRTAPLGSMMDETARDRQTWRASLRASYRDILCSPSSVTILTRQGDGAARAPTSQAHADWRTVRQWTFAAPTCAAPTSRAAASAVPTFECSPRRRKFRGRGRQGARTTRCGAARDPPARSWPRSAVRRRSRQGTSRTADAIARGMRPAGPAAELIARLQHAGDTLSASAADRRRIGHPGSIVDEVDQRPATGRSRRSSTS